MTNDARLPQHLVARNKLRALAFNAGWEAAMVSDHERDYRRRHGLFGDFRMRPGAVIERQSPETREMLTHLRAEDLIHDWPNPFLPEAPRRTRPRVFKVPGTCPDRQV